MRLLVFHMAPSLIQKMGIFKIQLRWMCYCADEAAEAMSPRKSAVSSDEQAAEDTVCIPLALESAAPGREVPGAAAAAAAASGELPLAADPLPESAADAMMAGGPKDVSVCIHCGIATSEAVLQGLLVDTLVLLGMPQGPKALQAKA